VRARKKGSNPSSGTGGGSGGSAYTAGCTARRSPCCTPSPPTRSQLGGGVTIAMLPLTDHRATTQTRGHPTVLLRFVHTRTHVHVLHIPRAHGDVAPPTEDPPSLPVPSLPVTRSQTRRHTRTNVSGRYYHSCAPHALIGTFAAAVTGSITYHGHTFRRKCVLSVRPIMPCWEIRRRGM